MNNWKGDAMTKRTKDEESSWLSMLKMELSLIDEEHIIEPGMEEDDDPEENETELGIATMEIRRLWTYFCNLEEKATRAIVDAKYDRTTVSSREEKLKKAAEMRAKAEMARSILFLNIRDQHGIWNPHLGVGLRRGWRIVSFKSKSNPLLDLLRGDL
jgi:hypothetical protein